jgi:tRNA (cmo5U34)-methyltransferase
MIDPLASSPDIIADPRSAHMMVGGAGMAEEYRFDPNGYREMLLDEVPGYDRLQDAVARSSEGIAVERILDLGIGTGETSVRVRDVHPGADLVGVDMNEDMLAFARSRLPDADLRVARLEDPLPEGPFDLVVTALAVHHLDGAGKADLFARVAARLRPGGRFVLADLVVPADPADVVTEIDGVYDRPSSLADQLTWLGQAGLDARVVWSERDLAVVVAERPSDDRNPAGSTPERR